MNYRWLSHLTLFAVLTRRRAGLFFEKLAERGWCGKIQLFGDFPNRQITVHQEQFGLLDDAAVNPIQYGHSADFTDGGTQMVGCKAQLVGIEQDVMLLVRKLIDQRNELVENRFLSAKELQGFIIIFFLEDVLKFRHERGLQGPDGFHGKRQAFDYVP